VRKFVMVAFYEICKREQTVASKSGLSPGRGFEGATRCSERVVNLGRARASHGGQLAFGGGVVDDEAVASTGFASASDQHVGVKGTSDDSMSLRC
jgi:hypothetical protein